MNEENIDPLFYSQKGVSQFQDFKKDFFKKVLQIDGEAVLITDLTSIEDFGISEEVVSERVHNEYGVKLDFEDNGDLLLNIFKTILNATN